MRASALACLLFVSCGASPSTDAGQPDAGMSLVDAGPTTQPDAGQPERDAGVVDAGVPARTLSDFWANTQWPRHLTLSVGEHATVYGQVWVSGESEAPGETPNLEAQLGFGAPGTAPATWTWTAATFNVQVGNNDEFKGELSANAGGVFLYGFRYRVRGAQWAGHGEWLYAGFSGPGLSEASAGVLAVRSAGAALKIATQNLACVRDDVSARLDALATRWAALGVDVVTLQEVCEQAPLGNTADVLARALATRTGRPWRYLFLQTHLANNTTPEGLGILTPLPVVSTADTTLPTQEFPRKALLAVVGTPVGVLTVVSTHFSFRPEDAAFRVQQAQAVLSFTATPMPTPPALLVAGDFNATPGSGVPEVFTQAAAPLVDAWAATHAGQPGYSFPSNAPTERIDYLLVRGVNVASATQEFTQPYAATSYVSDHTGFAAELR